MTEDVQEIPQEPIEANEATEQADVVEPVEPQQPAYDPQDAEEAKLFGWKSPDEWQGDKPEGYIADPGEFLERVQRSRIFKTMQDKLTATEQAAQEHARKMDMLNERALKSQREQYEQRLQNIRAGRDRAAEEGDMDRYRQLSSMEAEHLKNAPALELERQAPPEPPAEVLAYQESETGAWLKDPVLRAAGEKAIDDNPSVMRLTPQQQIEYAEAQVRMMYPQKFQTEKQPKPRTPVDPGGLAPVSGGQRDAFSKLPADAKQAFQRYVKEGLFEDNKQGREEFANDYNAA